MSSSQDIDDTDQEEPLTLDDLIELEKQIAEALSKNNKTKTDR